MTADEQLARLEQNVQRLLVQKQSVQSQLIEVQSALEELEGQGEAWRMIGNILVKADPDRLRADLSARKEQLQTQLSAVESQEARLRERAQQLRDAETSDG